MTLALRALIATFFSVFSLSAFAGGEEILSNSSNFDHNQPVYWQCSAHNSHDPNGHHGLFYGQIFASRTQAKISAISICEYNIGHRCTKHECHRQY